ncbi:Membrane carboxypeptidase (Penicillin-binding protein) [Frankia sp. AiPs1]|uniref:transglycosylase domain-containing protein n=1 Tax=Frankia sp. AiPa1 TaxID=573492 RepID=UPI00202B49BD|nr:transglycosylase domain-containing protein [Frankia sp. AiPa1]MCL9757657.1 transglycosylase domain-containing protein [Frankia sp. AiPa1]
MLGSRDPAVGADGSARAGGGATGSAAKPAGYARPPVNRRVVLRKTALTTGALGLVLALLALPLVGALGLFAKGSADHFLGLPSELITPPLPQSSKILASDGTVIATLSGAENRVVVDGKEIPKVMREAIVSIEDSRFYEHGGVDPQGVLRAALRNSESGSVAQGGSTLTQQYVKNVLLQNARTPAEREIVAGDSLDRKIQELRYALDIEKRLSKDEILERYLNIAYFGDGAYGVGTAAEHYFGTSIANVNVEQAAMLAGLVQSPSRYNPAAHPEAALARRNTVLDKMAENTYITATQADAAKQVPLNVVPAPPPTADSCAASTAQFFCDYVRTQLQASPALGSTLDERNRRIYEGGLVIRTTLDLQVQQAAQEAVNSTIATTNRVSATEVVIQPGTGNILAMAVNRVYGSDTAANQTVVPLPTNATFQPGSTFKTFVLAAALEAGYGTSTAFYSPSCYVSPKFPLDRGEGDCPKGYSNSDPAEAGVYDISRATWDSVNTFYVQLAEKVGIPAVVEMAKRLGVSPPQVDKIGPTDGATAIGGGQYMYVSPLQMADAYATIAGGGLRCTPRFATSVLDSSKDSLDVARTPQCEQVLSKGIADTVTSVLAGVPLHGTGTNAAIGRPSAGKTGTTDEYSAAWYVGFTPQMTAAVSVGDPSGAESHPLRNVVGDGRTWARVFGGDLPAIIFGRSMRAALANQPVEQLPGADPTVARGTKGGLQNTPPPPATPTPAPGMADLLQNLGQQFAPGAAGNPQTGQNGGGADGAGQGGGGAAGGQGGGGQGGGGQGAGGGQGGGGPGRR